MKNEILKVIFKLLLVCSSGCIIYAQSNPTAQNVPYNQDFSSLATNSTIYPNGFQGWNLADFPGSTYRIGEAIADKTLTASSTAATTSGNIHNYNQKIGFLNTGSLDLGLCLAINTVNKSGIKVTYDAMVIRNPYNGGTNTRINEMVLQYRLGLTGSFTTIDETAYASETTAQSTGTAPLNSKTISTTLPTECNNQNIVQLRWVSKQNSGSGSRPSFALDNIKIENDVAAPINTINFPVIANTTGNSFDFTVNLNEKGTSYYVLLSNTDSAPTAAQIKSGTNANNNPALQAGSLAINEPLNSFSKNITGLSLSTTYTLYIASEDLFGNLQPTPTALIVTTLSTQIPNITVSKNNLNFALTEKGFNSNTLSYTLSGEYLVDGITVSAPNNFSLSKTENGNYTVNLNFDVSDFNGGNSVLIYAKFNPNDFKTFSGEITHTTTNGSAKKITLTGVGINPYFQDFNDPNVLSNSGWTSYSVAGNQLQWASTTTYYKSTPAAMIMNGYAETGASNDWLISPKLHLNVFADFPVLSFQSRKFFTGPGIKLMISTNYDGFSNPQTANWTELNGKFPTETSVFTLSDNIDLSAYKSGETYLAWVYESTNSGSNLNAEWVIDDVAITNKPSFIEGNPQLKFGEIAVNNLSASQSFVFKAGGFGTIALNAPAHFKISKDNSTFATSVTLTQTEALNGTTIYIQFAPTQKLLAISGALTLSGTGLNQQI